MLQLNGSLFLLKKRLFKKGCLIYGLYSIFDKKIKDQKKNDVVKITWHKDKGQT